MRPQKHTSRVDTRLLTRNDYPWKEASSEKSLYSTGLKFGTPVTTLGGHSKYLGLWFAWNQRQDLRSILA